MAAPVASSTARSASVALPNCRATALRRSRSGERRSTGTTTAARNSWPPTKNAIASRCSQRTACQSLSKSATALVAAALSELLAVAAGGVQPHGDRPLGELEHDRAAQLLAPQRAHALG